MGSQCFLESNVVVVPATKQSTLFSNNIWKLSTLNSFKKGGGRRCWPWKFPPLKILSVLGLIVTKKSLPLLKVRDTQSSVGPFNFLLWQFSIPSHTTLLWGSTVLDCSAITLSGNNLKLQAVPLVIFLFSCLSVFIKPTSFLKENRTAPWRALHTHLRCQRFSTKRGNEPLVFRQHIRTLSLASLHHSKEGGPPPPQKTC